MNTIFITRVKSKEDLNNSNLKYLINEVWFSGIKEIYVITNFSSENNYKINSIPIYVVKNNKPTSSISMNSVFNLIRKRKKIPDAFIIASKEVTLKREKIKELLKEIDASKNLLVAGYKFKINNRDLNKSLQSYYNATNLIAYKIPWNTCAIWNYKLFNELVSKFDKITQENNLSPISLINETYVQTPKKGMEDGLAIAKAVSEKKKKVYFKLINDFLPWKISDVKKHKEKLARKEEVLKNFMSIKNYLIDDLVNAQSYD